MTKRGCFRAKVGKKEVEDLLANASMLLTRSYFSESGPKIARVFFLCTAYYENVGFKVAFLYC